MMRTVISGAINGNWVARDEIISSLNKNSIGKINVANEQKIRNSMTIAELKEFINRLPDTMGNYTVENAEYTGSNGDDVMYRLDKPVVAIYVREDTGELLLMNVPMEQLEAV